jgi:hypothetical protein
MSSKESVKKYKKSDKGRLKRQAWLDSEKGHICMKEGQWKYLGYKNSKNEIFKYSDFLELFNSQNNCCGICGIKFSGTLGWCVDHDHFTGIVRGILCGDCNKGIGCLRDDPKIMMSAIQYIKLFNSRNL